ncbi:HAD-IC family P-type ATPase [Candidatus Kaiserbacteria bacterium]|nr:HAD-IC family P-type ATPase [Candidatus Kaiserbacteria bacterium]
MKQRKKFGSNTLPVPRRRFLKLIARQFQGVFNILLIIAALITFALGQPIDALLILVFVFLGVGLSLFQEYKSNTAADKLKSYLTNHTTVRRGNVDVEIPTTEIVLGDIIKLESGDIVPADAIVRHALDLQVDETTFTGESIPVIIIATDKHSHEPDSLILQGSVVIRGTAYAEVIAIGSHTKLAQIAKSTETIQNTSELTKGVNRISNFILRTTFVTLLFVILANVFIEGSSADIPNLLIFAIALAVSVIPEALPLVITFSLSHGALRLAKKGVIVKRLASVQDLGSVDLLCTDKTGTLTENKLVYLNQYFIPESPFHPLVLARLAAHDLNKQKPEPFDLATDLALTEEQRAEVNTYQTIEEEAFDPDLRSNGVIVSSSEKPNLHIRRGSPEYFIKLGLVSNDLVGAWLADEEKNGRRVLGVSYDDGTGQKFGGFVSFADSLKKTTIETINKARELNVAITIITGDSKMVAEAIGYETGLLKNSDEVIDASDFFTLPALEQTKKITGVRVFARTSPEQKLALINLLKEHHTVGFLGEGINDAPALKSAHVSMVVQSASDVARETADVILTRSDLRVIIDGIRLGRETHANTLKYIRATLVSNFGNFYAVAIGSLFISFLPMLPKQILLLNLLSDFPMMAIAFDTVNKKEITKPQKYDFRSLYIIFITLGLISTVFDFMWFALFYKISPEVLQTNWFIASVITEVILLFSIRSMLPIEKAGKPAPIVIGLSAVAIVLALSLPIIPFTASFFGFTSPTLIHLGLILLLTLIYLITTELAKRPLARFLSQTETKTT